MLVGAHGQHVDMLRYILCMHTWKDYVLVGKIAKGMSQPGRHRQRLLLFPQRDEASVFVTTCKKNNKINK